MRIVLALLLITISCSTAPENAKISNSDSGSENSTTPLIPLIPIADQFKNNFLDSDLTAGTYVALDTAVELFPNISLELNSADSIIVEYNENLTPPYYIEIQATKGAGDIRRIETIGATGHVQSFDILVMENVRIVYQDFTTDSQNITIKADGQYLYFNDHVIAEKQ